jgi:plastocyanin
MSVADTCAGQACSADGAAGEQGMNLRRRLSPLAVAAVAAFHIQSAHAVDLKVTIVDATGKPAAGVAVLVDAQPLAPASSVKRVTHEVRQKNLRFLPAIGTVPVGAEVGFTNDDAFDHHVIGTLEKARFEFVVPAAESSSTSSKGTRRAMKVKLPDPGVVSLSCHLHASMHAHVVVTDLPFHGVTNDKGEIEFTGVKAGRASVSTWHPLMLTKGEAAVVDAVAAVNPVPVKLNYVVSPPRR